MVGLLPESVLCCGVVLVRVKPSAARSAASALCRGCERHVFREIGALDPVDAPFKVRGHFHGCPRIEWFDANLPPMRREPTRSEISILVRAKRDRDALQETAVQAEKVEIALSLGEKIPALRDTVQRGRWPLAGCPRCMRVAPGLDLRPWGHRCSHREPCPGPHFNPDEWLTDPGSCVECDLDRAIEAQKDKEE